MYSILVPTFCLEMVVQLLLHSFSLKADIHNNNIHLGWVTYCHTLALVLLLLSAHTALFPSTYSENTTKAQNFCHTQLINVFSKHKDRQFYYLGILFSVEKNVTFYSQLNTFIVLQFET